MIQQQVSPDQFLCVDLAQGEYLHVESATFGSCGCYATSASPYPDGTVTVTVRVELDDDHPSMADAIGDYPELDSDNIELYDVVPLGALSRPDGRPIRSYYRSVTDRERAVRARSRGSKRVAFPELSAGLRTQEKKR